MRAILRNRSLLLLGAAEVVNSVGSWITAMALYTLLIFNRHGDIGQSTAIMLAALVPTVVLSPLAGWLCDRFDRRPLMIASRLLSAATVTGLIFTDNLPLIYALLALSAACATIMTPARTTALPDIVAPEDLAPANAFLQQVTGLVKMVSPALAGALLTVVSPHSAMIFDVISYVLSALILMLLPALPPRAPVQGEEKTPAKAAATEGMWAGLGRLRQAAPLLILLLPLNILMALVLAAWDVSLAVYVRDVLQVGIGYKGIVGAMAGAGTIAGSAVFLVMRGAGNHWRGVTASFLLLTALPAAFATASYTGSGTGRILVAAGCLLGGLGIGAANVLLGTLFQLLCPKALLGRISGAFESITLGGRIAGMLLTPLLVPGVVSFGVYFAAATAALVLAIIWTAVAGARIRTRPSPAAMLSEVSLNEG